MRGRCAPPHAAAQAGELRRAFGHWRCHRPRSRPRNRAHCSLCLPALQAGSDYFDALLAVLKNVTKEETVQYVLALLDDLLAGA
jgi:hypothetical protein